MSQKPTNAAHYRRKFAKKGTATKSDSGTSNLESTPNEAGNFMESEVAERLDSSKDGLFKIIETYLDNDPELKKIAEQIILEGGDPMRAIANNDDQYLKDNPEKTGFLEVIVQTDGSRPSFLIRNGEVDLNSSPIGEWRDTMLQSAAGLKKAIECVGRINLDLRHVGTGWLVQRNYIVTNRHVLQAVAIQDANGRWTMKPGAHIDFGYEFKARRSINPRSLKKLIFCGPQTVKAPIDHTKTDLALIEIEEVPDEMVPGQFFFWDESSTWAWEGTDLYTIGYPGDPGAAGISNYTETLLDKLFKSTYGCKRIAPGKVLTGPRDITELKMNHDATTLGGNSGSVMLVKSTENIASGLHYGGDLEEPRENWGHVLGNLLTIKNTDQQTLRECLEACQVELVQSDG